MNAPLVLGGVSSPEALCSPDILRELMSLRAEQKDSEINSLLLKQLVSAYARVERRLKVQQALLDEDLQAAAEIQRSLLPRTAIGGQRCRVAWRFEPCQQIGGDCLGVFAPAPERLCLYVLDVSGHGVPAAMVAVSAVQALRAEEIACPNPGPGEECLPAPGAVLSLLDASFPLERFERHFTMSFVTVDEARGELRYSSAGHPPPLLVRSDGEVLLLDRGGPVIGLGGLLPFEEGRVRLQGGDRLLLYTDGLTECEDPHRGFFGEQRLQELLRELRRAPLDVLLDSLLDTVRQFCGDAPPRDDITLVALEYS